MHIRPATLADTTIILGFIQELADYEKASDEVIATEQHITNTLFTKQATAHCVICECDQLPVGFAVFFYNYSTWQGQNGLYLEDLYVTPEHRGSGAGKALLRHLAQHAIANNCGRFEWSVLDWNTPAIDFYESIGAKPQAEWIKYRLDGEALVNFAQTTC